MEYIKFKNFINSVQYGFTADETFTKGNAKYLRITDIVPYFVDKNKVPFVKIDDKKKEKYLIHKNDLLIARTGATTGYNLIVPKEFDDYIFASYLVRYFYDKDKLYPLYVKHVLKSKQWYGFIKNYIGGSAQPGMNPKTMGKFEFPYFSFDIQKKIATILNNYDQLIENNNKRIRILENMVKSLYKEWFVRFRFPEYEHCDFINGIPCNWEYKKFSLIYNYSRGISYSSEEIECDEGQNLINLKNIDSYGGFRRDGTKKYNGKYRENQIVKFKDLIMGITDMTQDRRTVGAVALVPNISGVISADLIKIESKINNVFSYCLFRFGFYSKLISRFGNGVNVIHLRPDSIKNQKILIPDYELIEKFVSHVEPMVDEIEKLNEQNELLVKQRDALLPRLMSGKLSVEGKEVI